MYNNNNQMTLRSKFAYKNVPDKDEDDDDEIDKSIKLSTEESDP
jgi:hypothetical protein